MNQQKKSNNKKIIFLATVAIVVGVLFFVFLVFGKLMYKPYQVEQTAMTPTLLPGDRFITRTMVFNNGEFKRGDIIVFRSDKGRSLVKRVIALPGETLEIKDGKLSINQNTIKESYIKFEDYDNLEPVKIKEGHYFVMGDNRPNSRDSRSFGPIKKSDIVGKVVYRYYPLNKLGRLQ